MQDCFRSFRVQEDGYFQRGYESLGLATGDFGLCRNEALVVSPIPGSYRVGQGVGLGGEEEGKGEGYGETAFICNAPVVSSECSVGREWGRKRSAPLEPLQVPWVGGSTGTQL